MWWKQICCPTAAGLFRQVRQTTKSTTTFDIEEDIYLLSMGPHMHYRGKAMRYELEYPDGEVETLLWIPNYDFNWQFLYEYKEPRLIPAGSTLAHELVV